MSTEQFVIVGGGRASVFAAEELRARGFSGGIRLIAAEAHPPYDHPPLSKGYLIGNDELDDVYLHPRDWYEERQIGLVTGVSADALDVSAHRLTLSTGEQLGYDRLLLATGARARMLGLPGERQAGVHGLRTIDDAVALREALVAGGRSVVIIGAGWIGMEIAASARALGNEVTVVGRGAVPLAAAIGDELGGYLRRLHERNGVVLRMETGVAGIEGGGRATGVALQGAQSLPADVVVVAAGAEPELELAAAAGLDLDDGVLTDESLATSAADVFAAGDIANAYHPVLGGRLRTEHWSNASDQGAVAARSMLGERAVFDAIPYFFTDQFDFGMEYSGFGALAASAEIVYRGERESGEFIAFWVDDRRRVVAGMNVNVWDVNEQIQALIRDGRPVDLDRLRDGDVELSSL